ncbi:hypothetical protein KUCAC02_016655, partial [Chaenocephalus aceratus]
PCLPLLALFTSVFSPCLPLLALFTSVFSVSFVYLCVSVSVVYLYVLSLFTSVFSVSVVYLYVLSLFTSVFSVLRCLSGLLRVHADRTSDRNVSTKLVFNFIQQFVQIVAMIVHGCLC